MKNPRAPENLSCPCKIATMGKIYAKMTYIQITTKVPMDKKLHQKLPFAQKIFFQEISQTIQLLEFQLLPGNARHFTCMFCLTLLVDSSPDHSYSRGRYRPVYCGLSGTPSRENGLTLLLSLAPVAWSLRQHQIHHINRQVAAFVNYDFNLEGFSQIF